MQRGEEEENNNNNNGGGDMPEWDEEHQQAMMAEVAAECTVKARAAMQLVQDMADLHEIAADLAKAVHDDEEKFEGMEELGKDTVTDAARGVQHLAEANKHSNQTWMARLTAWFATLFGSLGAVAGGWGMAAGAAVGSMAGNVVGSRSAQNLNHKADTIAKDVKDMYLPAALPKESRKVHDTPSINVHSVKGGDTESWESLVQELELAHEHTVTEARQYAAAEAKAAPL